MSDKEEHINLENFSLNTIVPKVRSFISKLEDSQVCTIAEQVMVMQIALVTIKAQRKELDKEQEALMQFVEGCLKEAGIELSSAYILTKRSHE